MAPLTVDPSDYLKPHHSAGRCRRARSERHARWRAAV